MSEIEARFLDLSHASDIQDGTTQHIDRNQVEAPQVVTLWDDQAQETFDRLTRLAAAVLRVPIGLVVLADEKGELQTIATQPPEAGRSYRHLSSWHPFFQNVIATAQPRMISDTHSLPAAAEPDSVTPAACAGIPLVTDSGHVLGCLAVIDDKPRVWQDEEISILVDLARAAVTEIELRATRKERLALLALESAARERTEAAEGMLRAVIEHVPTGIIVFGADGTMQFMNGVGRRISGLPPVGPIPVADQAPTYQLREPGTGRPFVPDETPPARALAGETVEGFEYVFRRPTDGKDIWISASAVPLRDGAGNVTGAVAVFADVTEERLSERAKTDFLTSAAHDLKTPLTSIKGFAQMLERRLARGETLTGERALEMVRQINATAGRMNALITDLLDSAHLDMGGVLQLQRRPVDLITLARRTIAQAERIARGQRIILESPDDGLIGNWDEPRLERVLGNLLSNAIKYSPEDSEIVVTVQRAGDTAVLTVQDHGIGIPAADLPRIFERFYRAENAAAQRVGTGIGLVGVRQLVEQHGGTVSVESTEGEGSIFTVRLPLDATT